MIITQSLIYRNAFDGFGTGLETGKPEV